MFQKRRFKINAFLNAIRFLTVIPVPGGEKSSLEELGRSTIFFPVVGLIIGIILAGFNWFLSKFLPVSVTSALLVAAMAIITGGLHLDGLTDTCDGVFVRRSPEERLRIMDDSRVGAFGVIGAILIILIKYAALSSLPGVVVSRTLIVSPVISRFLMVWTILFYPCARGEGLGWMFKQGTKPLGFIIALILTLAMVFFVTGFYGLAIVAVTWIIISFVAMFFKSRLGGLNGDTYGAVNEIAEALVFIMVATLAETHLLG